MTIPAPSTSGVTPPNWTPGDYVLATKYDDGGPCDHFAVGFAESETWHGRAMVVDGDGAPFRHNGFRRVEKISAGEGRALIAMFPEIGDVPGPSLWEHLEGIRNDHTS